MSNQQQNDGIIINERLGLHLTQLFANTPSTSRIATLPIQELCPSSVSSSTTLASSSSAPSSSILSIHSIPNGYLEQSTHLSISASNAPANSSSWRWKTLLSLVGMAVAAAAIYYYRYYRSRNLNSPTLSRSSSSSQLLTNVIRLSESDLSALLSRSLHTLINTTQIDGALESTLYNTLFVLPLDEARLSLRVQCAHWLLTYNSLELLNSKSYSTRYTIDKRQRSIDLPKAWDLILPASTFNDEFPEFWSPNHSPLLSASSTGPPTLPPADKSLDLLRLEIVKRLHAYPVVSVLLSRILNHSLSIQEAFLIYITAPHLGLWKITEKYGAEINSTNIRFKLDKLVLPNIEGESGIDYASVYTMVKDRRKSFTKDDQKDGMQALKDFAFSVPNFLWEEGGSTQFLRYRIKSLSLRFVEVLSEDEGEIVSLTKEYNPSNESLWRAYPCDIDNVLIFHGRIAIFQSICSPNLTLCGPCIKDAFFIRAWKPASEKSQTKGQQNDLLTDRQGEQCFLRSTGDNLWNGTYELIAETYPRNGGKDDYVQLVSRAENGFHSSGLTKRVIVRFEIRMLTQLDKSLP